MSRGLGRTQRHVLAVVAAGNGYGTQSHVLSVRNIAKVPNDLSFEIVAHWRSTQHLDPSYLSVESVRDRATTQHLEELAQAWEHHYYETWPEPTRARIEAVRRAALSLHRQGFVSLWYGRLEALYVAPADWRPPDSQLHYGPSGFRQWTTQPEHWTQQRWARQRPPGSTRWGTTP
jgi:hypothetical protein